MGEFDPNDFHALSSTAFYDYNPAFNFSFLPLPLVFHLNEKPGRKKEKESKVAASCGERSGWERGEEVSGLGCGPPLPMSVTHTLPHLLALQ